MPGLRRRTSCLAPCVGEGKGMSEAGNRYDGIWPEQQKGAQPASGMANPCPLTVGRQTSWTDGLDGLLDRMDPMNWVKREDRL